MEAFDDGVLAAILIPEGEKVEVGGVLAVLAAKGEDAAAIKKQYGAGKPAGAAAAKRGEPKQENAAAPKQEPGQEGTTRPEATANVAEARAATSDRPIPQEQRQPSSVSDVPSARVGEERIVASPLAKRMAADLGVDLAKVGGSGPGGRIVQKDIEDAVAAAKQGGTKPAGAGAAEQPEKKPAPAPARAPAAGFAPKVLSGQNQVVPLTKMRATIAQRLQASKQGLPHFYETFDIDCENVMALRGRLNTALEKEGVRLSLADFIAKALVSALQQHPVVNATFDGKQVTMHGDVNLGMAVALPAGLIVPGATRGEPDGAERDSYADDRSDRSGATAASEAGRDDGGDVYDFEPGQLWCSRVYGDHQSAGGSDSGDRGGRETAGVQGRSDRGQDDDERDAVERPQGG